MSLAVIVIAVILSFILINIGHDQTIFGSESSTFHGSKFHD